MAPGNPIFARHPALRLLHSSRLKVRESVGFRLRRVVNPISLGLEIDLVSGRSVQKIRTDRNGKFAESNQSECAVETGTRKELPPRTG